MTAPPNHQQAQIVVLRPRRNGCERRGRCVAAAAAADDGRCAAVFWLEAVGPTGMIPCCGKFVDFGTMMILPFQSPPSPVVRFRCVGRSSCTLNHGTTGVLCASVMILISCPIVCFRCSAGFFALLCRRQATNFTFLIPDESLRTLQVRFPP